MYGQSFINQIFVDMVDDIVCGTLICNLRQSTVHFSSTITVELTVHFSSTMTISRTVKTTRTIYPQKYDQPFINQIFVDMVDGIVCGMSNLTTLRQQ